MLEALTITEAEAAGLSELAALDLAMAKDFAARAQAAEDPATASDLERSYHRAARSYRQTLALKMRLAREMASHAREVAPARPAAARPGPAALKRAHELRAAVERVAWNEHEGPEGEPARDFIRDLLEDGLLDDALDPAFAWRPLDEHVAETCEAVGLDPDLAARWRDLPDPPADPPRGAPQADPGPAWRDTG